MRYPLLIVHDGADYLDYTAFRTVLDNLIHRGEVAEMVVAFLRPATGWWSMRTTRHMPGSWRAS